MHEVMDAMLDQTRDARRLYGRWWMMEHLVRGVRGPDALCRWVMERRLQAHRALITAAYVPEREVVQVPRREGLTHEEFEREYLNTDTPVVMVGAAKDWPCVGSWSPTAFAERFPDEPIVLLQA